MKKFLLLLTLPGLLLLYQNCGDGFAALTSESFSNIDLSSELPQDLNQALPKTLDDLLQNSTVTLSEAERFYSILEAYGTSRGIGLSAILTQEDDEGDIIFDKFRNIEIFAENQQLQVASRDFTLLLNHDYATSLRLNDGRMAMITIAGNPAEVYFNMYNADASLACSAIVAAPASPYLDMLSANGVTYIFQRPVVNTLATVRVVALDANCNELWRRNLSPPAADRRLFYYDAKILGNRLYLSLFAAFENPDGSLDREPLLAVFDLNGNLLDSRVYSSPGIQLSAFNVQPVGNEIFMAGIYRQNQFASTSLYHFKVDANLQPSGGAIGGHDSEESAQRTLLVGNKVYVLGTMEHPRSELEAVFYYSVDIASMAVTKQVIIDSPETDALNNAHVLRDRYLGLAMDVGNNSAIAFVDDSVSGVPQVQGFNTFADNLVFSPITIQGATYNLQSQ